MKPLTTEQLKALRANDWVWVIDIEENNGYYWKFGRLYDDNDILFVVAGLTKIHNLKDYGNTWVVYKNKEEAENNDFSKYELTEALQAWYYDVHSMGENGDYIKDYAKRYNIEIKE